VKTLVDTLNSRGFNARKCWVRSPHTVAFLLWRFFVGIGFYRVVTNQFGFAVRLPAFNRNKYLRSFWATIEFFGVLPNILRVYYSLWRGRTLIAERYVLDTITTIAYFLDDIGFLESRTSKLLLRFIPDKTAFIFLDADYETIYQRRAPSFVEPRPFIDFQRTAYKIMSKYFYTLVVDTSENSIAQTSAIIMRYLGLG
jgi:hypothetical protein